MDVPTTAELIASIESFCRDHDVAETRFGREATGEPQLLASLRKGRSPSLDTASRIVAFMAARRAGTDHGGDDALAGGAASSGKAQSFSAEVSA